MNIINAQPTADGVMFGKVWQHPYIDLFKSIHFYTTPLTYPHSGDVNHSVDPILGKKVLVVKGSVPAANYIDIPGNTGRRELGLTGQYVYIQLRTYADKYFVIHIDIATTQGLSVRLSCSNLHKEIEVSKDGRVLKVPCSFLSTRWSLLSLHIPSLLEECHLSSAYRWEYKHIKNITICSNVCVRAIVTSDIRYTIATLPRDIRFPIPRNKVFDDLYDWYWITAPPAPELSEEELREEVEAVAGHHEETKEPIQITITAATPPSHRSDAPSRPSMPVTISNTLPADSAPLRARPTPSISRRAVAHIESSGALTPDPIMSLTRIIGYTSRPTRHITWANDGKTILYPVGNVVAIMDESGKQEFLTGHTLPVHLITFSNNGLLATGQEGKQPLIRIWDYEKRTCLAYLMAHHAELTAITFSQNEQLLAAVGKDHASRYFIMVWDITGVMDGKVTILAKQTSEWNISKLMFSPYRDETLQLVSCGHESVRFWRIKTKHLPGASLALNEHSRNTFTDMAFEAKYGEADHMNKRMYVSTASGSLFQINYATRQLECIYKLHSGPIHSISINEGFCVTGSGDCFLRVWPLDFSDFYLQAQHKGAIHAVQISLDGLHVLVGTANGTVGVLDLSTTAYTTRVRSHLATINAIAFDPNRDEFATVSEDGTIRVWGLHSMEQIYEFYSPHEHALCLAYHPSAEEYRLACGFGSGSMRVMDIATTTMHVDYLQHHGAVLNIVFSHDGLFLYTNGADGNICAYDVKNNYLPTRLFTTYRHIPVAIPSSVPRNLLAKHEASHPGESTGPVDGSVTQRSTATTTASVLTHHSFSHAQHCHSSEKPKLNIPQPRALVINEDDSLLATIGSDPTTVVLLETSTLKQVRLFSTLSLPVAKIQFAHDSRELCIILEDSSFQRFEVASGRLIGHVKLSGDMKSISSPNVDEEHPFGACLSATLSPKHAYLLTGTSEPLVRVWSYSSLNKSIPQTFLAHQFSNGVTDLIFSRDGEHVLSVGGQAICVWKFEGKELMQQQEIDEEEEEDEQIDETLVQQHQQEDSTSASRIEDGELHEHDLSSPPRSLPASPAKQPSRPHVPVLPLHQRPLPFMHYRIRSGDCKKRERGGQSLSGDVVLGFSGHARRNVIWKQSANLLAYTAGHLLILEPLQSSVSTPGPRTVQIVCDRHTCDISTLTISTDGRYLASGSAVTVREDGRDVDGIRVWDTATGHCIASMAFDDESLHYWHEAGVQSLSFDPMSHLLTSVGCYRSTKGDDEGVLNGQLVAVWDWEHRRLLASKRITTPVHGSVWLSSPSALVGLPKPIEQLCTIEYGHFITYGDGIHSFYVANVFGSATEIPEGPFLHHELIKCTDGLSADITAVDLTPDGNHTIVAGTTEGDIYIWDKTGAILCKWRAAVEDITAVICARSGRLISTSASFVSTWQINTAGHGSQYRLTSVKEGSVSVDGNVIAAAAEDKAEVVVVGTDLGTLWYLHSPKAEKTRLVNSHTGRVYSLSWSADDKYLASASEDGSVRVWHETQKQGVLQIMQFVSRQEQATSVQFHPTQPKLVAGYSAGTIRFFSLTTLSLTASVTIPTSHITALTYVANGALVLAGTKEGHVFVVQPETKRIAPPIPSRLHTTSHPHAAHLSHSICTIDSSSHSDDLWLVTDAARHVSVWRTSWKKEGGKEGVEEAVTHQLVVWINFNRKQDQPAIASPSRRKKEAAFQFPTLALFSPVDADVIIASTPAVSPEDLHHVLFYSLSSKRVIRMIPVSGVPISLSIRNDGRWLAVGNHTRTASLYDLAVANPAPIATSHSDYVTGLEFNHKGTTIASSSNALIRLNSVPL